MRMIIVRSKSKPSTAQVRQAAQTLTDGIIIFDERDGDLLIHPQQFYFHEKKSSDVKRLPTNYRTVRYRGKKKIYAS